MANMVTVNGRTVAALNSLSCGPGCTPHTYELSGGAYVYEIAGQWWLQERGRDKRRVEVGTSASYAVTDSGITTELGLDAIIANYAARGYGLGAALRTCALGETFTWYDVTFTRVQVGL